MNAHVANDTAKPLTASLRIALYRDGEVLVEQASTAVSVPPHGAVAHDLEAVIGRFVDVSWSYRFGPPGHDLVVASLEAGPDPGDGLISQAFRFPVGRPLRRETAAALGLELHLDAGAEPASGVGFRLRVRARRVVHGVRIEAPGFRCSDDSFTLEPGVERELVMRPAPGADVDATAEPKPTLTALNLSDRLRATPPG
jgi:beta-mannosidase